MKSISYDIILLCFDGIVNRAQKIILTNPNPYDNISK